MKNDIRVSSWKDLQDQLFRESYDEGIQRFRSPFVYRGLSDVDYYLITSLIRLGGPYEKLERHLLRNFRKYAYRNPQIGTSLWNWLALAQHHGLPTRLLDWTYSPYVALHFATCNIYKYDSDGVIWCVNYVKSNDFLPQKLRSIINKEGSNVFTPDLLDTKCKDLSELDSIQKKDYLMFLEPPSLDDRIVNQHALFSMLSSPEASLSKWLEEHPDLYFRIIIPAELKWEVRDKLDQANITERVLFPGLDGLSRWLRRHYSPKDMNDRPRLPVMPDDNFQMQ